jgi:hypothetical protein
VKPVSDRRLSDLVSVGLLTKVFPPDLVDEVISSAERRNRSLPARVMAYFAIGMALYSEGSYEDVLAQLTDGLSCVDVRVIPQPNVQVIHHWAPAILSTPSHLPAPVDVPR